MEAADKIRRGEDGTICTAEELVREFYGGEIPEFDSMTRGQAFPFGKIGYTADGYYVRDRIKSHFHAEDGLSPDTVRRAIQAIDTGGAEYVERQIEFPEPIGLTECVEVGEEDIIIMAYRKNRTRPIPMVLGRSPEPSNVLSVALRKVKGRGSNQGEYRLVTAYAGEHMVKTPGDPHIRSKEEQRRAEEFWLNHALVFNAEVVDWEKTNSLI